MTKQPQRSSDSLHSINAVVSLGDTNDRKAHGMGTPHIKIYGIEIRKETEEERA